MALLETVMFRPNSAMASKQRTQRWVLAERPVGSVSSSTFRMEEAELPAPTDGQVLVRTLELSVDPAMRGWIGGGPSYREPVQIGATMDGLTTGVVVSSNSAKFSHGDRVLGVWGWTQYAIVSDFTLTKLPANQPTSLFLGAAGVVGLTAYFGLLDVAQPKAGETILVSGAAGATGSIVGQIAKILGLRVVGTAGGEDKCKWLRSLGFDAAIDYKNKDYKQLANAIKEACPQGVDIYFENVGGDILEIALDLMNLKGRIAVCGMISGYNSVKPQPGPRNLFYLISKRLRMEGFLVLDYVARFEEGRAKLLEWIEAGKIQHRETVVEGFEHLPKALMDLFEGTNTGKMIVRASRL